MTIYQYSHPQYQNTVFSDRPGKEILKAVFGIDNVEILLGTRDCKNWGIYLERGSIKQKGKWQGRR